MSTRRQFLQWLGLAPTTITFKRHDLPNGAIVYSTGEALTPEALERLKAAWQAAYRGGKDLPRYITVER